jgi:hypothetical protein
MLITPCKCILTTKLYEQLPIDLQLRNSCKLVLNVDILNGDHVLNLWF